MKRDCHDAVELLAQRLRASPSDADERRLAAHLDACEACRTAASDQRFVEVLMAQWPDTPAEDTAAAVAAVRARVAGMRAVPGVSPTRVIALAAAATILVATTVTLARYLSRSSAPDPPCHCLSGALGDGPRHGHGNIECCHAGWRGKAFTAEGRAGCGSGAQAATPTAPHGVRPARAYHRELSRGGGTAAATGSLRVLRARAAT